MKSFSWFVSELRIPVWRRRFARIAKSITWCTLWIGTLLVLATLVENWRGRRAWNDYVQKATAAGESFDDASLIPPPIPDSDNFATAPIFKPFFDYTLETPEGPTGWLDRAPRWHGGEHPDGFRGIGELARPTERGFPRSRATYQNWRRGVRADLALWQEFRREHQIGQPDAKFSSPGEELLHELRKWSPEEQGLRIANQRPRARFPLRYEDGPSVVTSHFGFLQGAAQFLRLRVLAEMSLKQTAAAFEDQLLAFRLVESLEGEPLLISLLVRISLLEISMPQLWEGLAGKEWSEEHLAAFDQQLTKINLADQFDRSLRWERNRFSIPAIDLLEEKRDVRMLDMIMMSGLREDQASYEKLPLWVRKCALWLAPEGWFDQNKVTGSRVSKLMQEAADSQEVRFFPDRVKRFQESVKPLERSKNPYTLLGANAVYGSIPLRCASAQATVNLARIAIALERHRIRHGSHPKALEDLAPLVGTTRNGLPHDPASGSPPRYKVSADGTFELYYDGWNGADDGGITEWRPDTPGRQELDKGDWTWPVAKAE